MGKPDLAHRLTDQKLAALEKRIAAEYKKAADEMSDKINAYFESFKKRDAETKELIGTIVNSKEYTDQDYKQWRLAQIGRGKRFEALRDEMAERMTNANEIAANYMNDEIPKIFALNHYYQSKDIAEQVGAFIDFTVLNDRAVKRLIRDRPDLMPHYPADRAIKRGIDLAYGKRKITEEVTSGILQGESIKDIADRLQKNIPNMNRTSAIRAARTAVTGAESAGRYAAAKEAEKIGINSKKQWAAIIDNRTRHSHRQVDGETVGVDDLFSNGLFEPGDPSGDPSEVYNCRCHPKYISNSRWARKRRFGRNPETGQWEEVTQEQVDEWKGGGR